jgi:predicted nuclease with TOPRIM domain
VRRVVGAAVLVVVVGGCGWLPLKRVMPGGAALAHADDLARAGAWEEAVSAYGQYLRRYPDAEDAPRAEASRDTLRALLTARAEGARLREETERLREEMAHLRDELVRRDADLVRLRHEAERLRADLEKLKQIDFRLERRK